MANDTTRSDAVALTMKIATVALVPAVLAAPYAQAQCSGATCAGAFVQSHLASKLAEDPTAGRLDTRIDGKPWIAQNWGTAPFALTPSDTSLALRASSAHLRDYANSITARRYEAAKELAPNLKMPKPAIPAVRKLDVWSTFDVQGTDTDSAQSRSGQVGADYKLNRKSLVGVSAGLGVEHEGATAAGQTYQFSAYAAYKPVDPITFDVKAAWGEEDGTLGSSTLAATHNVVTARMRGNWSYAKVRFSPALSIANASGSAVTTTGGDADSTSRIAVEPRLSRPFEIGDGAKLEPYLRYRGEVDFNHGSGAEPHGTATTDTLGAGMTLASPGAYTMSVTTDVTTPRASEDTEIKSRLQLAIPLK